MSLFSLLAAADTESAAYKMGEKLGALIGIGLMLGLVALFVVALVQSIRRKSAGWIVTAVLSGLVSLLVLAGSVVAVVAGQQTRAKALAAKISGKTQTLSAADGSVSMEVPGNWKDAPKLNEDAVVGAKSQADICFAMIIANPKTDYEGTLQDIDKLMTAHAANALEKSVVADATTEPVGPYPALRRRVEGVLQHVPFVFYITYFETKDTLYQLTIWTSRSHDAANAGVIQQIISSVKAKSGPPEAVDSGAPAAEASPKAVEGTKEE